MLRYTLRYLALVPLALLGAHLFGFAYAHLVGPLHAARNPIWATQVSREPLLPSYAAYLADTLRLDLGALPGSSSAEPVLTVLGQAAVASLGLLAVAMLLSVAAGVGLGLAAVRDGPPRIAPWLTAAATVGLAAPSFYIGVLGIAAVIIILIWAPGQVALLPLEGYGWGRHLVLPTLTLMLRPTAQIAQITAAAMVNELGRQYVVTARSFGHTEQRIRRRHAMRNALPAMVAGIAGTFRFMAGELILVETLFYWPGIGRLLAQTLIPSNSGFNTETALFLNPPIFAATLTIFAALFLLSNFAAALAVRGLDPRLR